MTKQQAIELILADIYLQNRLRNHAQCVTYESAKISVWLKHREVIRELS